MGDFSQLTSLLVATHFPDISAAFRKLREHGGTLYIPNGTYPVSETIDLSGLGYDRGIRVIGDGRKAVILGDTHGKPIIDLTATGQISFENVNITSKSANVGILHGRSGGRSAGCCNYSFVFMEGAYSLACVYNLGSEVNRYYNCLFWNNAPGGHGYIFTYRNYFDIESPYIALDQHACNTDLAFYGCFWGVYGGAGTEVNLYLLGPVTADVSLYGGDMSNKQPGRAAILLDARDTYMLSVRVHGMRFETAGTKHCIEAINGNILNVQISENMMESQEESIFAGGSGWKENWTVTDNMARCLKESDWGQDTGRPAMRFDSLVNSTINGTSGQLKRLNTIPGGVNDSGESELDKKRFYPLTSIRVDKESHGNHFIVRQSEDINLPPDTTGTRVAVLNDDAYGREYFHGVGVGTPVLLNLLPCDTAAIPNPKKGDVVLDSGKNAPNGIPTLAIYDGKRWRYLQTSK